MATPDVTAQLTALETSLDAAAGRLSALETDNAAKAARIAELEAEVLSPEEIAALDRIVQKAATLAPTPALPPAPMPVNPPTP